MTEHTEHNGDCCTQNRGGGMFLGLLLIFAGCLWLFRSAGLLPDLGARDLLRFSPAILILLGISLLPGGFWSGLFKAVVILLLLFLILSYFGLLPIMFPGYAVPRMFLR